AEPPAKALVELPALRGGHQDTRGGAPGDGGGGEGLDDDAAEAAAPVRLGGLDVVHHGRPSCRGELAAGGDLARVGEQAGDGDAGPGGDGEVVAGRRRGLLAGQGRGHQVFGRVDGPAGRQPGGDQLGRGAELEPGARLGDRGGQPPDDRGCRDGDDVAGDV